MGISVYPVAGVIFDASGNLYGTTPYGLNDNGMIYKLIPDLDGTWSVNTLHRFINTQGGANPFAGVVLDSAGNLYGAAQKGGAYGYGTVFKLTPASKSGWSETVLHAFTNSSGGGSPYASLIFDSAGNLYGTTLGDGISMFGSVFEITP